MIALTAIAFAAGCDRPSAREVSTDSVIDVEGRSLSPQSINGYLEKTLGFTSAGGQVRCAHTVLGQQDARVFLETFCMEFVRSADTVTSASGRAGPVALTIAPEGDSLRIVSHEVPADGGGHAESMRRIFPADIVKRLSGPEASVMRARMLEKLRAEAEKRLLNRPI